MKAISILALAAGLASVWACDNSHRAVESPAAKRQNQLSLARTLFHQAKYKEALILAEATVRDYPDYVEAHLLKGQILHGLGAQERKASFHEQAIAAFDKAIELDDKSAVAHMDRGMSLMAVDRPDEADQAFERAHGLFTAELASRSWDEAVKLNLALIAHARGDTRSALDQVELILTTTPDFAPAEHAKAMLKQQLERDAEQEDDAAAAGQ